MYVHTPFCQSKCKFCVYNSEACSDYKTIKKFLSEIPNQINLYKELFNKLSFDQVYFGGGTPTILLPADLRLEFSMIPDFEKIPVKCIEASPSTITTNHLSLLKEYDFSYISFGIQSLDPAICKKQNRKCITIDQLSSLAKCLKDSHLAFNFDFIAFLNRGDLLDLNSLYKDLIAVIQECRPTYITVHKLYQATASCEQTRCLELMLKHLLQECPSYSCANSDLCNEDNYFCNTIYGSEYRLMCSDADPHFSNYLWGQYPQMPVAKYDVLSIGFSEKFETVSNANDIVLKGNNIFQTYFDPIEEHKH